MLIRDALLVAIARGVVPCFKPFKLDLNIQAVDRRQVPVEQRGRSYLHPHVCEPFHRLCDFHQLRKVLPPRFRIRCVFELELEGLVLNLKNNPVIASTSPITWGMSHLLLKPVMVSLVKKVSSLTYAASEPEGIARVKPLSCLRVLHFERLLLC